MTLYTSKNIDKYFLFQVDRRTDPQSWYGPGSEVSESCHWVGWTSVARPGTGSSYWRGLHCRGHHGDAGGHGHEPSWVRGSCCSSSSCWKWGGFQVAMEINILFVQFPNLRSIKRIFFTFPFILRRYRDLQLWPNTMHNPILVTKDIEANKWSWLDEYRVTIIGS